MMTEVTRLWCCSVLVDRFLLSAQQFRVILLENGGCELPSCARQMVENGGRGESKKGGGALRKNDSSCPVIWLGNSGGLGIDTTIGMYYPSAFLDGDPKLCIEVVKLWRVIRNYKI